MIGGGRRALWLGLLAGWCAAAGAQFQLEQWTNFEDGAIPEDAVRFGTNVENRVRVVDRSSVAAMPPEFSQTAGAQETGNKVLELESVQDPGATTGFVVGVAVHTVVDRDQLGPKGMALFQADFFVPPEGPPPAIAVVATEPLLPPPPSMSPMPRDFYRFGIGAHGFYFSCVSRKDKAIEIYHRDAKLWGELPRPGWHRLAIVCEGSETLRCYVDGRETSFSPVNHPSLRKLQVGIMLAENKVQYKTYADNLSIQISGAAIALPESPYAERWKMAASTGGEKSVPLNAAGTGVEWLDPEAAWKRAQQTNKPLLLYFHSPADRATRQLNELLATRAEAKALLAGASCAQVDVDQLQGGSIARKYNIVRVPSFLVITPQATEAGRATFSVDDTWETFAARLTGKR